MSAPSFAAIAPGRLAVVTGAASGIGLATARALAERGMRVALVDRAGEALDAAAGAIEGASMHALDVADPDALVTLAEELGGAPALLMNNAAIGAGGDVLAGVATADRRQPDGRAPRRRRLRPRDDRVGHAGDDR